MHLKTFCQPLSAKEEAEYIRLMKMGNPEEAKRAKECLIEHNLRLVAHIVKKYQNVNEDPEDLLSIGCIGLIKAIDTFDVEKGRLATYACRCIDNELLMLLRSNKKRTKELSLFDAIGQDKEGNEIRILDVFEQEQSDPIEVIENERRCKLLYRFLEECLSEREREILTLRYGLNGAKTKTQHAISEQFHISRSYVSRIEKRALQKLRKAFEISQVQEY